MNIQLQRNLEVARGNFDSCRAAYVDLLKHPQKEIIKEKVLVSDWRICDFFYFCLFFQGVEGLIHLFFSDDRVKLLDDFFPTFKKLCSYLMGNIKLLILVLGIFICMVLISFFLIKNYKKDDGFFLMMYLAYITFGFILMDKPIVILCLKVSNFLGGDNFTFHPLYIWFITMVFTFFIFSIIIVIKNHRKKEKVF